MKKVTSFLLALVMVVSLLPGAVMPAAAADTPKQNNYYSHVIVDENFDNINTGITKGLNGTGADEQYTVQGSGAAHFKTGTMTTAGVCKGVASLDLATTEFDLARGFEVSFEATFNDLVVMDPAAGAAQITSGGFVVDVRAARRCRYGFFADAAGSIFVSMYDMDTAVCYDTGADVGDMNVSVRIVVDDDMNSTVTVDGHYVGRFDASEATAPNNHFVLYTGTMNRVGDSRVNDVLLYDLKLSQAPEANEVQAYYTFNAPYLNGRFDEFNWAFDNGSKMALLSDENYLYVALAGTTNPAPAFTVNGVTVTADLAAGEMTAANGEWAGNAAKDGGNIELRIPLKSVLGLDYAPGQKVDFDYQWGGASFTGTVVLAGRALVAYEGFDGSKGGLGSASDEVYAVQNGDGKIQIKTGTYSKGGVQELHHKIIDASEMDIDKGMEFEFTADFTDLVAVSAYTPSTWYEAGFGVEVRAEPCRRYGFHADASGNIYIAQRESSTRVDTGLKVGAAKVHVRLAAADSGETTIYINGNPLSSKLPASRWTCPLTGGLGYYRFYNSTTQRATSQHGNHLNDVTLYDLALYQDVPLPELREYPMAAGDSVDITAYLNPNGIELDGVANEAEWYTPYAVKGTDAAPGGLMGISWGNGMLYIGGETEAEVAKVKIAGQQVAANLRPYQAPPAGRCAASNTGFEWVIPLSRFGMTDGVLGRSVAYEIILANNNQEELAAVKGTLTFSAEQILLGDTGRNYSGTDYLLGHRDGHVRWERSDDGYTVTAEGLNALKSDGTAYAAGGTFYHEQNIPVDYTDGAFDLTMSATINDLPNVIDFFGMRGLNFEVVGDNVRAVFALYKDARGNILAAVRDELEEKISDTGMDVGSGKPIEFHFAMDDQKSIHLYVNGTHIYSFDPIDRRDVTATAVALPEPHFVIGAYNGSRGLNADGTISTVDVVIHNLRLTKNAYPDDNAVLQAALDQITEESILGGGDPTDVTKLVLPGAIYVHSIGETVYATWSATEKQTGRTAYNVDLKSGTVSRLEATQGFNLKVTLDYKGISTCKNFAFQTKGTQSAAGSVALIENDDAPANGVVQDWNSDRYVYLDDSHNSVVVNRGGSLPFNRIVLRDSDEYSRVSARHLGVFISDDGQNWTKVTGWMLHQSGRTYTLYNLNETAQYVKVHCYHDDMDLHEGPTFYNRVSDMIKVSNEKSLPGIRGKFAHTKEHVIVNTTGKVQRDAPVFVGLNDLGAAPGQYKVGCADFRFTMGDTILAHWYNGKDGFYVRMPELPAAGAAITAHWGCDVAEDFSDGEAVFEVTYGNVSLVNLSKQTYENSNGDLEQAMLSHGRPFTFPNGDVIVVARTVQAASNAAVFRSTDGGHTFRFDNMAFRDGDYVSAVAYGGQTYRSSGFGGFLWDGQRDENPNDEYVGRLYVITYSGQGGNDTDYRLVLNYTDDYGATWSEPVFLSVPGASDIYKNGTTVSAVSWLKDPNNIRNTGTEVTKRAIIYGDGLKLAGADGSGPNVDYVIVHSDTVYSCTTGNVNDVVNETLGVRNVTTAIYSTDNGATWTCSDTLMSMPGVDKTRNTEDGLTEFGFAQLDNGDLRVVMRAQAVDNYYQYEGVSTDFGKTWTAQPSGVLSSNTSPVLTKLGDDRLEMWSACTGLGMASYRRTPMHLGLSTNNYESFDKIIDLTLATAFDSVQNMQGRKAQPGIGISADGTSAFVCYYDQTWHKNPGAWTVDAGKFLEKGGTMGIAIEEFDQMVYGTKGAWEDFEDSSLKYQGWLVDTFGSIELSREQAVSGKYSMKVLDESASGVAHALRQIPSAKSGTVGAKMMVPNTNEAPFVMELKAAYNYTHMLFTVAAIYVTPAGTVGYVDADGTQHVLTTVKAGSWNDYALAFDVETGKGTLYVNGVFAGSFDLPDTTESGAKMHGVTVVQFNQMAATIGTYDCLYVDDFYANELVNMVRSVEDPVVEESVLGRFVTIVRKVIEIGGEIVELVEWGWIPGL